jgi:hypothetical protein
MVASRDNMMFVPFVIENDRKNTGFAAWRDAGNYYSIAGANFSLLRGGYGYIKGLRVEWSIGNAAVVLTANVCNFLGIDETGQIVKKTSLSDADWEDNIWLFAVLYDGTIAQVCKWNRPFNVPVSVARGLNGFLGPIIRSTDGIVLQKLAAMSLLSAAAAVLDDSGLTTALPALGAGITWNQYYVNAAGKWVRAASNAALLNQYNNAGVPTALTADYFGVYRLYAGKETLNAADAQYFAVMHRDQYLTQSEAEVVVEADAVQMATNELAALGLAHIGYVIFRETAGGDIKVIGNVQNLLANQVRQQLQIDRASIISGIGDMCAHSLTNYNPTVKVGTWGRVFDALYLYSGYLSNTATHADHDSVDIDLYCRTAGTYRLTLNAPLNLDAPIVKVYVDTVQVGVGAGYDLYAAGLDPLGQIEISGLKLTAGKHTVRLYADTKNGASASFIMRFQRISLVRTA